MIYDNDTGPDDDYFYEFWSVFDTTNKDKKICQCDELEHAIMICDALNEKN